MQLRRYLMISLPERITYLMNLQGINSTDLVKATKLNKSSICRLLNGETNPKPDTLYKLARFFKVSMEFLLIGDSGCTNATELSYTDKVVLQKFNKLSTHDQNEIIGIIDLKLQNQKGKDCPLL